MRWKLLVGAISLLLLGVLIGMTFSQVQGAMALNEERLDGNTDCDDLESEIEDLKNLVDSSVYASYEVLDQLEEHREEVE